MEPVNVKLKLFKEFGLHYGHKTDIEYNAIRGQHNLVFTPDFCKPLLDNPTPPQLEAAYTYLSNFDGCVLTYLRNVTPEQFEADIQVQS